MRPGTNHSSFRPAPRHPSGDSQAVPLVVGVISMVILRTVTKGTLRRLPPSVISTIPAASSLASVRLMLG